MLNHCTLFLRQNCFNLLTFFLELFREKLSLKGRKISLSLSIIELFFLLLQSKLTWLKPPNRHTVSRLLRNRTFKIQSSKIYWRVIKWKTAFCIDSDDFICSCGWMYVCVCVCVCVCVWLRESRMCAYVWLRERDWSVCVCVS